jgi:hypothetical protein
MIEDHRAARRERASGGKIDLRFELGQRRLFVVLAQFSHEIGIVLGAVHGEKVN